MQGVYRARVKITGVTAAKVLLYLAAPSTAVLEILSAKITDLNQNTSEQIHAKLARATGTVGGGDVITPKPTELGSAASGSTAKGGGTAITGMTADSDANAIASHGANKLAGWEYVPLPEDRDYISPSDQLIFETITTITSSDLIAEIVYREIGT